jgi:tRNA (guanine-N7-)-methyltransferase
VLKQGGKIYVITDVKELFDWEVEHLDLHPLFSKIPDEELKDDPCIAFMSKGTDEA